MFPVAVFVCFGWILSVCLHEFGHAVVAYWGGDTSVKDKGYLTLNPLKYTDINLSLILPIIFLLMGGIALPGAAVYIDQRRLRSRWWQSAVSAAGPITSVLVTLLLAIPFKFGLASPDSENWIWPALAFLIFLDIYVVLLNSLPIPPLDGYGVIEPWLPREIQTQLRKFGKNGIIFLFLLLWWVKPLNLFLGQSTASIAQFFGVPSSAMAQGFILFHKSSSILLVAAIGVILLIRRVMQPHEVWCNRGSALINSQQHEKAFAAYEKAIQIKPDDYDAWYNRGLVLIRLRRNKEALASYDKAIRIKPNDYNAWFSRGWTLHILQRYEEALFSYDKAIQSKPDFAQAWHHQGCVLNILERYEEAVASYNKAIEIKPDNPAYWIDRGGVLCKLQRYEEALASCEQAIKINPKSDNIALAWHNKACCYAEQNNIDLVIKTLQQAMNFDPHRAREWAKTEPSFDSIRENQLFKQLIG